MSDFTVKIEYKTKDENGELQTVVEKEYDFLDYTDMLNLEIKNLLVDIENAFYTSKATNRKMNRAMNRRNALKPSGIRCWTKQTLSNVCRKPFTTKISLPFKCLWETILKEI